VAEWFKAPVLKCGDLSWVLPDFTGISFLFPRDASTSGWAKSVLSDLIGGEIGGGRQQYWPSRSGYLGRVFKPL